MIFLPDTNAWIRFLNPGNNLVKEHFLQIDQASIQICSIVKAELYYGAMKSSRMKENLGLLDNLFVNFKSLPFDDEAAEKFGEIRATLARLGTPIGPYDLQIAAVAIVNGLTLVSHNMREFLRVPGLQLVDWEQ